MNVLIYCGSRSGNNSDYEQAARNVGTLIANKGWGLVYGGGSVGVMGIVAQAALDGGANVIGVIPTFLATDEVSMKSCTELIEVPSMHARKLLMIERSDVIVALPGAYGTMDELFEAVTWLQLDLHSKPIGVLNVNGFYDSLEQQFDRMTQDGFLTEANRRLIVINKDPDRLLQHLTRRAATGVSRQLENRS